MQVVIAKRQDIELAYFPKQRQIHVSLRSSPRNWMTKLVASK